jgi:N-acetylmuramoyl-L-alanine amidase
MLLRIKQIGAFVFVVGLLCFCSPRANAVERELASLGSPYEEIFASGPKLRKTADGYVQFEISLSQAVEVEAFTLAGPDRIVVDFPELTWMFNSGAKIYGADVIASPIQGLRVGLFKAGRSRLVLDLADSAKLVSSRVLFDKSNAPSRLEVVLRSADMEQKSAPMPVRRPSSPAPHHSPSQIIETASIAASRVDSTAQSAATARYGTPAPLLNVTPRRRPHFRTIVIDPGHGGKDPGAIALNGKIREKDITLKMALKLRDKLQAIGGFNVVLTRDRNVFVPLEQRVAFAQKASADLFISLHADSIKGRSNISGASVYTLSDKASDALAADLARQENVSRRLSGVSTAPRQSAIRQIIVDYARQSSLDGSERVAETIISSFRTHGVDVIKHRAHRHAAFVVLKNFTAPAVLVELGFLTNQRDRQRLISPQWQNRAADALARAIMLWSRRDSAPLRILASSR